MEKINEETLNEVCGGHGKIISAGEAEAITKTVENGKEVIIKNGKKYTASGTQLN